MRSKVRIPALRVILPLLMFFVTVLAPFARNPIAAIASTKAAASIEHCIAPDAPDQNGPSDKFGRPMRCESGEPIIYAPDEPKPAPKPVLASGGPIDTRLITNLFAAPVQIDGQLDWDYTGSVQVFSNGDLAYTVAQEPTWGENTLKVVRPTRVGNTMTFPVLFTGLIQGRHLGGLTIADVDGLNGEDIIVVSSDDPQSAPVGQRGNANIFWSQNTGHTAFTRTFFEVGDTPYAVTAAPINGGKSTVGIYNWNSNTATLFNQTTGTTLTRKDYPGVGNQAGWDRAAVGDFNHDGKQDIAFSPGQNSIHHRFFYGDGAGNFTEGTSLGTPPNMAMYDPYSIDALKFVDVTKDGLDDMLVASGGNFNADVHQWGSRLWIYDQQNSPLANGSTFALTPTLMIADDIPSSIDITPVDCGDTVPDWWTFSDGWERSMYLKGNPNGGFFPQIYLEPNALYANGTLLNDVTMVDLNGDGWKDEVASYDYNGLQYRLHRPCVELTVSAPAQVYRGDSFVYTITLYNNGLAPVQGMVLTDTLDVSLINATPLNGGTVANGVFTSPAFDLAPGATKTFQINVTTTTVKTVQNTAVACALAACTAPATATTIVRQAPITSTPNVVQFGSADYNAPLSSNTVTVTVLLDAAAKADLQAPVYVYKTNTTVVSDIIGFAFVNFVAGETSKQVVVSLGADKTPTVYGQVFSFTPAVLKVGVQYRTTIHRATVEPGPMVVQVFLPMVVRNMEPIKINDAVARRTVVGYPWIDPIKRTYIDKTITVIVPQNGKLHVSSSATELKPLTYDDALDIYLNGVLFKTVPCTRGDRPFGCEAFELNLTPGATVTLRFVAYDTEMSVIEAFEGWLIP